MSARLRTAAEQHAKGAASMAKVDNEFLFNLIAPVYNLFFRRQKKSYADIIEKMKGDLDLTKYQTALDVGCGSGAFCAAMSEIGLSVTGVDSAANMLSFAKSKPENKKAVFVRANVLEGLPFDDNSFDFSTASYVAHGLTKEQRKLLYAELGRVSKFYVIIHDYNRKRSLLTTIIEWLEGGDYFEFIKTAESEMKDCISLMRACFSKVRQVDVGAKAAWYICTPNESERRRRD
jgi:SAM-dependent methyltransferase